MRAGPRGRRAEGLVVLALALAACGGGTGPAVEGPVASGAPPAYGDTLIEALTGNVSGLIPNILSDSASFDVAGLLYDGLVTRDAELALVGDMARRWQFSPDCLTLTFELKPGIRWHDGRPFTADDVVFTYETMIHPRTPTAYREDFHAVERVEALDPLTVRVTYRRPYAKALQSWGLWMLPRHLLEPWVREGRLREAPQNWQAPVGTGPYRFASLRSGEKIELVAFPGHHAGRPWISRVVFRIIPSQATIFLELKAGGVDVASLTALQYRRQTDYPAFRRAYHKFRYPASGYTYLGFNLRDPRFADRRVRQAFAHAIDKRALIDGVTLGLGREATGPYKPDSWAYNPRVRTYPYDPARARALLAEAGWRERNAAGLLVKAGRPFTFELLTNQGNDERKRVAELIQAGLRDIGVGVELRVLEWSSFLKEYVRKRRFEAVVLGWGIGPDPDQFEIWHSSKTGPDELNFVSYANPEVDALLERGRQSCRDAERRPHYDRLQEVLADDLPVVFLYFRDALPVVAGRVHGIRPSPNGIRHNFPQWYVPLERHRYTAG